MERKISLSHIALYRGWLSGLSLSDITDLYPETGVDLHRAKEALAFTQDILRRTALQQGRYGDARLLRLRLGDGRRAATTSTTPPYDEYRARVDPDNLWNHAKLLAQYRRTYRRAFHRRPQRIADLVSRQNAAIARLEPLVAVAPMPDDPLELWLDETLLSRLHPAGVVTAGDLTTLMIERGYHWYAAVPGLGRIRATRLTRWVAGFPESLGELPENVVHAPGGVATSAVTRPDLDAYVIAPLEVLVLPRRATDPSAPRLRIDAPDDRAAILAWLDICTHDLGMVTRHAYRQEAERLLLWALNERGRSLGQLTVEDCFAYRDFLMGLGQTEPERWRFKIAQEAWTTPRYQMHWRPFAGPLTPHSVRYAVSLLRQLYGWLMAVAYITRDPWLTVAIPAVPSGTAPEVAQTFHLTPAAWANLQTCTASLRTPARQRADALLWLAVVAGLRRMELANATTEFMYAVPQEGGGVRHMLKVRGKNGAWRAVHVPEPVMQRLRAWWRVQGWPTRPALLVAGTPLIGRLFVSGSLTLYGITRIMKTLFHDAQVMSREREEWEAAQSLARAGAYWFRHTSGEMLLDEASLAPLETQPSVTVDASSQRESANHKPMHTQSSSAPLLRRGLE